MPAFKIELTEQQTIIFRFEQYWESEEIVDLQSQITRMITDIDEVEQVQGADRQYLRFSWQGYSYILQFESYGQSCWLESDAANEAEAINVIHQHLLSKK